MSRVPFVTSGRLLALGLALLGIAIAIEIYPSHEYIFLPDKAHPTAPIVFVQGGHDPARGGVYYVDVEIRPASLLERLLGGWPHKGADLYPAKAVNPPGVSDTLRRKIDLEDMHRSQEVAAAVALRALGKPVRATPTGVLVDAVGDGAPAVGKLAPDDVIVAADGKTVRGPRQLFAVMAKHKPGDVVTFTVRRGTQTLLQHIKTIADPLRKGHAIVGIEIEPAVDIHLPVRVRIDAGNVGGPSAGLAFALEVMEEEGQNVVFGHKVAATGEIFANGAVGAIGGIKQKTIGARESGVDAFLVPVAGDNAKDARKYAHGLRIIPVKTFQQALRALKTAFGKQ